MKFLYVCYYFLSCIFVAFLYNFHLKLYKKNIEERKREKKEKFFNIARLLDFRLEFIIFSYIIINITFCY